MFHEVSGAFVSCTGKAGAKEGMLLDVGIGAEKFWFTRF